MDSQLRKRLTVSIFLTGVLALGVGVSPAQAQLFQRWCPPSWCPPPPCPQPQPAVPGQPATPGTPQQPGQPPTTPTPEQPSPLADANIGGERGPSTGGETAAFASANMLGDQLSNALFHIPRLQGVPPIAPGVPGNPNFPPAPGQAPAARVNSLPSIRSFKISENENPEPVDRFAFSFNYFNNVDESINNRLSSDIHHINIYRETFAFEKTFLEGNASIGIRAPVNTLTAESGVPGLGGESTAFGALSVIFKGLIWRDPNTGSLLSGGLLISTPTGPNSFAGFNNVTGFNDATLQPFIGYRWVMGNLFFHGFLSFEFATDSNDVSMFYDDMGIGYIFRREEGSRLTAIVPTFEVHVNLPLDHRGASNIFDPVGSPDIVDLTLGTSFVFNQRTTLSVAAVAPVTGPRPFDIEALAFLNIRFGAHCDR
jgi:hypothetical protein